MKKFLNTCDSLLSESLSGFAQAHSDILELSTSPFFINRKQLAWPGKVALVSGGGSGHEPLHIGLVGHGMLDAACPGQIFTSPTPDQMLAAAEATDTGGGVLFIVKNYAGDVMNFEIAAEMLPNPNASLLIQDDIAIGKGLGVGRRGVAGTLIAEKIIGAAAENGANLATCKSLGERIMQKTATVGVALNGCTVPAIGHPTFELGKDEMEMGVGIHGERGHQTLPYAKADAIVDHIAAMIDAELNPQPQHCALLHVNGFGATPLMELYLVYELAARHWQGRGVRITRSLVGNYTTALDMAGCSITLTLLDEELTALWDAPVHTAHLRWGC